MHQSANDESCLIFIQSRGAAAAATSAQPFDAKCKSCHDFPQICFPPTFWRKNGIILAKLSLDFNRVKNVTNGQFTHFEIGMGVSIYEPNVVPVL